MITPSIFLPRRGLPRGVSRGWTGSFSTICGKFVEELPQLVPLESHSVDLVTLCEALAPQVLVFLSKPGNLVFEGIRTGAGSVRLIP
jgi:hypothetical protein